MKPPQAAFRTHRPGRSRLRVRMMWLSNMVKHTANFKERLKASRLSYNLIAGRRKRGAKRWSSQNWEMYLNAWSLGWKQQSAMGFGVLPPETRWQQLRRMWRNPTHEQDAHQEKSNTVRFVRRRGPMQYVRGEWNG